MSGVTWQLYELCTEVSRTIWYIINDTKIQNFRVSRLLSLLQVDAIAIMSSYSLVRACDPTECEIKLMNICPGLPGGSLLREKHMLGSFLLGDFEFFLYFDDHLSIFF